MDRHRHCHRPPLSSSRGGGGLFGSSYSSTTTPSSSSSAAAPTPILKKPSSSSNINSNSSSNNGNGNVNSSSRKRSLSSASSSKSTLSFALPPIATMKEEEEEEASLEESDTDIASHCDDELMDGSFSFDADDNLNVSIGGDVDGDNIITKEEEAGLLINTTNNAASSSYSSSSSPMLTSPVPSRARAKNKIRRLNLTSTLGVNGSDNDSGSSSLSSSAAAAAAADSSPMKRGSYKPTLQTKKATATHYHHDNNANHATAASPNIDNDAAGRLSSSMLLCPPSTVKKRKPHSSRLFDIDHDDECGNAGAANTANVSVNTSVNTCVNPTPNATAASTIVGGMDNEQEHENGEDVSPRDVIDFPFFPNDNSPPATVTTSCSRKSNNHYESSQKENETNDINTITGITAINPSSPSVCPPSTIKKKETHNNYNNSMMISTTKSVPVPTATHSPPRGLRTFGRVNSFLQMFSVEEMSVEEEEEEEEEQPINNGTTNNKEREGGIMELGDYARETATTNYTHPDEMNTIRGEASGTKLFFQEYDKQEEQVDVDNNNTNNEEEEEGFLHKPRKLDRNGSIVRDDSSMMRGNINVNEYTAIPSPRRPVRTAAHRPRFTTLASPSSPPRKGGRHSDPLPTTTTTCSSSSSSFSRFQQDFEIVGTLGNGTFGCVYSVRNRTDLRLYAIKAAKREARGPSDKQRMLQEVYALAALSDLTCDGVKAMHIVRYHQAWMEGNRLYIQTELCELTLAEEMSIGRVVANTSSSSFSVDSVVANRNNGGGALMEEKRRYKLLREMLLALSLVHENKMIHLDIKPENIFIKNDQYKLGDFGLVSKLDNHSDVEEGDSRYMSMELLSGDLDDLTKSDIFSLGATLYEICLSRSQSLPENGQEWQDLRNGKLLPMPNTPFDMQMIIREMMHPDRHSRPSAEDLLKKRQLLSDEQRQLIVERNKANAANTALDAQMQRFKLLSPADGRKKFHRSNTIC